MQEIKNSAKNIYSLVVLLITVLVIGCIILTTLPGNLFTYDVLGYYLYLPAGFKYQDITLNDYDKLKEVLSVYHTSEGFYQAFKAENGNWVMKYPMGLAVLYYPFYVIGHNLAIMFKYPTDGFSRPYQLSVLFGCYFYTILGLSLFRKILLNFFTDHISAIVMILVIFGTNYLLHVSIDAQPAMSHSLIYMLHAITIYYTIKWHKEQKLKYMLIMGLTVGITTISRPTEALIIFVPLLYNVFNIQTFKQKIKLLYEYRTQVLSAAFIAFVIVSYQLLYWKIVTGNFVFDSYSDHLNEGFNFKHPYILEFLFSFRKGWLLFTPIMIFALIGFYFFFKNGKEWFFAFFIYFILNLYVISSWSCWWYGISFSSRALIPAYIALAISFGFFFKKISGSKIKYVITPFLIILVIFNLFQSWQASLGILDGSRMTRAYYKSVFLQTKQPTEDQRKLLLLDKYASSGVLQFDKNKLSEYKMVFRQEENFDGYPKDKQNIVDSIYFSKNQCFVTNKDFAFAGDIIKPYEELTKKSYLIVRISAQIFTYDNTEGLNSRLVLNMQHKGKCYDFRCLETKTLKLKQREWNKIQFYYLTPDFWDKKDIMQAYFWNMSDKTIFVDNLKVEAFEPLEDETVF